MQERDLSTTQLCGLTYEMHASARISVINLYREYNYLRYRSLMERIIGNKWHIYVTSITITL